MWGKGGNGNGNGGEGEVRLKKVMMVGRRDGTRCAGREEQGGAGGRDYVRYELKQ